LNPLREIWFNTGKCIEYFLIPENRKPYLIELVWIQGIVSGLYYFLGHEGPLRYFYLIVLPVLNVVLLRFLFPWILQKTGKLMNGKATRKELELVISLSSIPFLLSLIYIALVIIIPGKREYDNSVIQLLIWIFYWRIIIIGVAKAQRIRYGFALMNIVIPSIPIMILYLVLKS
jgi:hypothetical protein